MQICIKRRAVDSVFALSVSAILRGKENSQWTINNMEKRQQHQCYKFTCRHLHPCVILTKPIHVSGRLSILTFVFLSLTSPTKLIQTSEMKPWLKIYPIGPHRHLTFTRF